jgi:AP-1 complex subunit gamma-1
MVLLLLLLLLLLAQVMVQAGSHVKEEVVRALLVLIANAPDLHAYSTRAMYRALTTHMATAEGPLLLACVWSVGEYGEMLLPGKGPEV